MTQRKPLRVWRRKELTAHFDGSAYDFAIELELKYQFSHIYQAARTAQTKRREGKDVPMPIVCKAWLNRYYLLREKPVEGLYPLPPPDPEWRGTLSDLSEKIESLQKWTGRKVLLK